MCVNPRHLRLGTQLENIHEAMRKGRMSHAPRGFGEAKHCARLKEHEVIAIRASDEKGSILAARYDVSEGNIWMIRKRRTWKHLL